MCRSFIGSFNEEFLLDKIKSSEAQTAGLPIVNVQTSHDMTPAPLVTVEGFWTDAEQAQKIMQVSTLPMYRLEALFKSCAAGAQRRQERPRAGSDASERADQAVLGPR